jgi:hypothetical protein
MFGTGKGISQKARSIVVDGDLVLCPCGKNRVIVGSNPRIFVHTNAGSAVTSSARAAVTAESSFLPTDMFDEQVRAAASIALDGYPYFVEMVDGRTSAGRVDASGKLPRIVTDDANKYIVYWGDQALARQEGAWTMPNGKTVVSTNSTPNSVKDVALTALTFQDLWDNYVTGNPYDDPSGQYKNQCAIRMSATFHSVGIEMKSFSQKLVKPMAGKQTLGRILLNGKSTATRARELAETEANRGIATARGRYRTGLAR